jgi:hypothetical protein
MRFCLQVWIQQRAGQLRFAIFSVPVDDGLLESLHMILFPNGAKI